MNAERLQEIKARQQIATSSGRLVAHKGDTMLDILDSAGARRVAAKQLISSDIDDLVDRVEYLQKALAKIAEGRGRFSRDDLTFAGNVIEEAKKIAIAATAGTWEPDEESTPERLATETTSDTDGLPRDEWATPEYRASMVSTKYRTPEL